MDEKASVLKKGKKSGRTKFLVLDDKKQTWFIVEADSIEGVADKARKDGREPRYVVEERFATRV
ncbi:hypothetical protein AKJ57_03370 [candidate division MSBL1 archaeon SCGC-AAA259A05]|uniref:Uncharacterized protein n=1 Tax=candidate division MSBL1 archaeon SCGC-AAA259A05 TaxID=1698259 RepID=A0A133U9J6_9EURY|nr:hypothetical protein AKJ57_03370 [candidate division MSBL1 archaeon SCGC-AAA259A05]